MRVPLTIFFTALTIRLAAAIFWQFDGLYGQDPFAYLQQGLALADNLPRGRPPPADFFWPNGYPLLIAFFTLFAGKTALAGQLVALLCGSLLPALAYLLAVELFVDAPGAELKKDSTLTTRRERAGLLAGLMIAVAGQPILSSVVVMADMPALFWATLAAWLTVRATNARQTGGSTALLFLAAGASLALAIITRWLYGLLVPALGCYTIYKVYQHKQRWWLPLFAAVGGVVILAPQLWLSLNKPSGLLHSWLLGWNPANFFLREFENIDGHFFYQLPVGLFYAQPAGHPAYIFPLLGLVGLWGIWRLWRAKQWGPLILLLGWAAPVYLFLGGIPYQNFRFGLTLYPPLVILTGIGLADLLNRHPRPHRYFPGVLKALIALSLLGMLAWAYPMLNTFLTAQNHSKTIARRVEQTLPPESTLLTFGLTLTLQHYTRLNTLEIFHLNEASLNDLMTRRSSVYLLLNLPNINTQWQGKTPQRNYRWFVEHTTLTEIEKFPPYLLFKADRE